MKKFLWPASRQFLRNPTPRSLLAFVTLTGSLAVSLAPRQAAAQQVAAAEALFERGLAAMQAKDFVTGCPAIEESYRLDPRPGTMFTLAECENQRGRIATAATRYEDYLSFFSRLPADMQAQQGDRARVAAEQRDALRARSPRLTIAAPPQLPSGASVTLDRVALSRPSWGVALPVDPGEHVVRLEAPGHQRVEKATAIREGQAVTVQLELGPATTTAQDPGAPPAAPPTSPARGGDALTGVQTGGLILGGIGVIGLGVGAVFGLVTMGHASTVSGACDAEPTDGTTLCNGTDGPEAADAASTTGAVSTIGFGVGAAALAGGILMFILGDDDGTEAAMRPLVVGDHRGGLLGAAGTF
jgi:hypothetical protein